jgi:SAM-dependent methyltransferase
VTGVVRAGTSPGNLAGVRATGAGELLVRARGLPGRLRRQGLDTAVARRLRGWSGGRRLDDPAVCTICGATVAAFDPHGGEDDRRCPSCGSLGRHRLIWLYFRERTNLFTEPVRMLHVAPEPMLARRLRRQPNVDYVSADLNRRGAMLQMDICAIDLPDDQFDVIYASHVLEHIPDDEQAMRELYRVLKPGGWAVLQVPMKGKHTIDEPLDDPAERKRAYGHPGHRRLYGRDGEYEKRLRQAGFDVRVDGFARELDPAVVRRHRLSVYEDVHFCTKPAGC